MDNRISPLENLIFSGFAKRFYQVFGTPLVYTSSVDKKAAAAKMAGESRKYPFAFATFTTLAMDTERYSPRALSHRGIASQSSHDAVLAHRLSAIPTTTTFTLEYVSQELKEVHAFAKRWLFSSLEGSLKFSITYGVVDIDISVELDQEITMPQRTDGVTEVNELELSTTFRIRGFHSKDQLGQMQAVTSVEVEGIVASQEEYKALSQEGKPNVEIHLFKRQWNSTPGPEGSADDPRDVGI